MQESGGPVSPEERDWSSGRPENKSKPADFDADLKLSELKQGARPGDLYLRMGHQRNRFFRKVGPGRFVATPESDEPTNAFEKSYRAVKRVLIGRPLGTAEEAHQRLNKIKALAVFGSDPISSCAYATEEAMLVLVAAGSGALGISFFLALAVSLLLSMVAFSYRQTFRDFVRPLIAYVDAVHSRRPDAFVTIVLPEFITAHWWERFLHNRYAARLQGAFERHPNVAVVLVPYRLER